MENSEIAAIMFAIVAIIIFFGRYLDLCDKSYGRNFRIRAFRTATFEFVGLSILLLVMKYILFLIFQPI